MLDATRQEIESELVNIYYDMRIEFLIKALRVRQQNKRYFKFIIKLIIMALPKINFAKLIQWVIIIATAISEVIHQLPPINS